MAKKVPKGAFKKSTASERKWKDPVFPPMEATEGKYPLVWRFCHADKEGPFSWLFLTDADCAEVLKKIPEFETKSIDELNAAKCHQIDVHRLEKPARDRLVDIKHDDLDKLMTFHISGERRLWCIKDGNLMRVLWWDPKHEVYKTEVDRADRIKRRNRN